ncbi:Hypothetical predicted protein [Pelobates cultripes]|uniref:Uncharacterized protein n=1 Tax=Pelobates cultripes TaxID=61616 RepID=A0AAD1TAE3_PELCU|nr:Hypothetical predicted protein [Pelobates cultripes]
MASSPSRDGKPQKEKYKPMSLSESSPRQSPLIRHHSEKIGRRSHSSPKSSSKVDANNYVLYNSGHYTPWLSSIPKGQFQKIWRNCTNINIYEEQSEIVADRFIQNNYPIDL